MVELEPWHLGHAGEPRMQISPQLRLQGKLINGRKSQGLQYLQVVEQRQAEEACEGGNAREYDDAAQDAR